MKFLAFSDVDEVAKEILSYLRNFKEKAVLLTYSSDNFEGFADKVIRSRIPEGVRVEDHAVETLKKIAEIGNYDLIVIGATRRGKEIAPRLAQKLHYPCVTDVTKISFENDSLVAERLCFSGRTVARIKLKDLPAVISVVPKAFEIVKGNEAPEVIEFESEVRSDVRVLEIIEKEKSKVDLEKAEIVIGLGRGVGGKENISKIAELKELLGAEFGSTRPVAYDYSWLPEDTMIGFSGRRIKPELYIAVGISGQIQHVIGVLHARRILAINKDENAPIFEYADYGIVGSWEEVLPKLIDEIKKLKK